MSDSQVCKAARRALDQCECARLEGRSQAEMPPESPGIYIICKRAKQSPLYVGETVNLSKRFRSLWSLSSHSFRRTLRERMGRGVTGRELSKYYRDELCICWATVAFGRKEIEELLVLSWRKKLKLWNKKDPGRTFAHEIPAWKCPKYH